jgi:tungstate transport system ATP-binding protein
MADPQFFLDVQQLTVHRGQRLVLDIPQLSLQEGEVLAVAGPNGAGKSTFLLAIAGLIRATTGSISINKKSANTVEVNIRKQCALVLQEPLLLHTSVRENIGIGCKFRGVEKDELKKRVDHWQDVFGLSSLSGRQAYRLSGGEAQRVSLARAFATGADLLLLDEPFSSLDAPTRFTLLNEFQSILKASQQTAIFITHDLDEALMLGDQIAILIDGKLRQAGAPRQVFSEPADSDVADFVGVETIIAGDISSSYQGLVEVCAGNHMIQAVSDLPIGKKVFLCLRPEDITLQSNGDKKHSSARNQIPCRILTLQPKGPLVRVFLDCGFAKIVSLVTRTSALEMNLIPGLDVSANFKASAIHLLPR